ncbi:hypothetical protein [Saccharothrix syringae]|uniref:Uncharacterized protein n=1 Tax=Saccharothrix syringae TaxID=103733 RepID=A0A5Q0GZB3_SACSY|nr:hypothetical protein [Saccharothrix syringae]QFZ19371.1 hypothetical protein EKG83_19745 [Saccharothrix syringae]
MSDERLTPRERAALLVLMAEARELTNAQLHEVAGFKLEGDLRLRLNKLGLVTSTLVGRSYVHELTDQGAVRCAAELSAERPARAGAAGGALQAVLAGLRRHLDDTGGALADLFPPNVVGRVAAAYAALARRRGDAVGLADLRERLDDVPREDFDRAVGAMARRDGVHLWAEPDQKALTERDHRAAVVLGGTPRHLLVVEAP